MVTKVSGEFWSLSIPLQRLFKCLTLFLFLSPFLAGSCAPPKKRPKLVISNQCPGFLSKGVIRQQDNAAVKSPKWAQQRIQRLAWQALPLSIIQLSPPAAHLNFKKIKINAKGLGKTRWAPCKSFCFWNWRRLFQMPLPESKMLPPSSFFFFPFLPSLFNDRVSFCPGHSSLSLH